jgi:uncharacterized protein YndB with AHSA1/START domain
MTNRGIIAALALAGSSPAAAEVKSSTPGGFEVEAKVTVAASAADVYAALGRIGEWWDPAHSYSGKGENLSLDSRIGGCFCERLEGGGAVEHLRVVYAQPGQLLRLQGGLGPLQAHAVAGTLTWTLKPAINGTEISQTYIVGGYIPGGADKLAPLVDQVLAEQLQRLQAKLGPRR